MKPLTKQQIFDLEIRYPEINEYAKRLNFSFNNKNYTNKCVNWYENEDIWKELTKTYKLSEEFIREFKDQVDWETIQKRYVIIREEFANSSLINALVGFTLAFRLTEEFVDEMKKEGYIKE